MLLDILKEVEDHRDPQARQYKLHHVLYFTILALLSNVKTYTGITAFIEEHFVKLKELFSLNWRQPPGKSCIHEILTNVDVQEVERAFRVFSSKIIEKSELKHIAFDGKVLNGSFSKTKNKKGTQLFQVFAAQSKIILAHQEIDEKKHEIKEFQDFLMSLNLEENVIVTADSLHLQKKTSK